MVEGDGWGIGMRGPDERSEGLFSYVSCEARVPADHPLRPVRAIVDQALEVLSRDFERLYSQQGRPSIAPEKLLRALLLQAFYSVRSERQLMEQLDYNLLFRWFVGLSMDASIWDATVFTKNRDRLLAGDVAAKFMAAVLSQPRVKRLLSDEHFSVDGTLIEAWASMKSFRPKDGSGEPPGAGRNGEREAALALIERHRPGRRRITLAADKAYDVTAFVAALRARRVTPHIAIDGHVRKSGKPRKTAIDKRTTRHPGYALSQRLRKRIEEPYGWVKTIAVLRKTRHRGVARVGWMFTLAMAAYDVIRIPKLLAAA